MCDSPKKGMELYVFDHVSGGLPQFTYACLLRLWMLHASSAVSPRSASRRRAAPSRRLFAGWFGWRQPEPDMGGLHGLGDHGDQFLSQLLQVHLIAQGGTESFQRFGCIVPSAVEAAINDPLDGMAQGLEEGSDHQGRGDNDQGILLLAQQSAHQGTKDEHEAHVEQGQDHRQGTIDERATNENINLPQPGAQNSKSNTQGHEQERGGCECSIGQLIEGVRRSQSWEQACDEVIQDNQHKHSSEAKEQPLRLLSL